MSVDSDEIEIREMLSENSLNPQQLAKVLL